ncbi:MAG: aminotransferase class I/II-fold pyridoxal phosphate-dependent enzyme [Planctomycetes bacterium]|nr:aminotransferase class I/II-fold pyridoxal phosphate-dependent enzyme [Planctomycetota bacterium]
MTTTNYDDVISARARELDISGIRKVFELGAKLRDPINFSIGQPNFPVPDSIKQAAINAINSDRNGYTLTQGIPELRRVVSQRLLEDVVWETPSDELGLIITSGTNGGLFLSCLAMLNPGDEVIIPDPYFVVYPAMATMAGATAKLCNTYPDFRMTAQRVEPLITDRTKFVLLNSPSNPSGVVLSNQEMQELAELCERRGVLIVSDEIYDEFTYSDAKEDGRCPSPARYSQNMILIRGYGKTYGCTGWRLGYAAGPKVIIDQMQKLQQYTFVCAPSMAQAGVVGAFEVDMREQVKAYQRKRDMVEQAFDGIASIVHPGGAFYAFVEVPEILEETATGFVERAIENNVLLIPGCVFSSRDTHFRLSYAVEDRTLERGLEVLRGLMKA